MKKPLLWLIPSIFLLINFSCKNSIPSQNNSQNTEIWEGGISMITGVITSVKPEKDGQTIRLTDNIGNQYSAIISIPNLGDNSAQYREFKVGETIGFRGNLSPDNQMMVREVLELR